MKIPLNDVISVKKNEIPGIYDFELNHIEDLKDYKSVEAHLIIYPYSRMVSANDIHVHPYEEYAKDISTSQRSAYTPIKSLSDNLFGVLLGMSIALVFARYRPEILFSVESIVSIFAAYTIGKELWGDIEEFLEGFTHGWRLRYLKSYYIYQLNRHSTLTQYSYFARRQRYHTASLLAETMDFIEKSSSHTIRLKFDPKYFKFVQGSAAHILSIHVDPSIAEKLEGKGFMVALKLTLSKGALGFKKSFELLQSLSIDKKGCLDENSDWIDNSVYFRKTMNFRAIKFTQRSGIIPESSIIKNEVDYSN